MTPIYVYCAFALGGTVGIVVGFLGGRRLTEDGLRLARYDDALKMAVEITDVEVPLPAGLRSRAHRLLRADARARQYDDV
jgi:hypothetical protein